MHPPTFKGLADFIVNLPAAGIPDLARQRATDAIIDCLACGLAGSTEELAPKLRRVISAVPASDPQAVPLLGTQDQAAPRDAALYNGTVSHALDYDDVTHPAYSHPSAVLVPVLMSLCRQFSTTGAEAMAAYVIGIEVFGRLGRALNTDHYRRGWHPTCSFGTLAAAAMAARLMRLTQAQTGYALGIAGSAASGLRANFGTMTKPLHCGYAARNGILAAQMAAEGFTANDEILTVGFGFASTFNHGGPVDLQALTDWGGELEILSEFGLALKPYPSCAATHTAIEAAVSMRKMVDGSFDSIASIRIGVPEMTFQPILYVRPETPLQGKFSMHYCVAAAMIDGDVNLKTFSVENIRDPAIGTLVDKIKMEADARMADNTEFGAVVSLTMRDGRQSELMIPLAIGKPDRWFTHDQLRTKFIDCASLVMGGDDARRLFGRLCKLADEPAVTDAFQLLSPQSIRPARTH